MEYARLFSIILEYEDPHELSPVAKKRILDTYADLKEAILFHQQHVTGIKSLLIEEAFISLNLRIRTILGQSNAEPNTIFLEKVPLPEDITVHKQVTEDEFQYNFEHVTLGHIGKLICKKGIHDMYRLVTRPSTKGHNKKEKQKIYYKSKIL
ncbi:hypothetical protein [Bacillus thuringiensis]|uniref:hypothetical protein n=1 Tax=Bacillus thuringiensis TaxID=1428 RepID=UPI0011A76B91|nr:hypothetical protein [Bacillus thuringiensis]